MKLIERIVEALGLYDDEEDVIEALENVKLLEYNKAKINDLLSSNTEVYNNIYEGLDEEKFNELYTLINSKNKKGLLKIILPIISLIFFILSLIYLVFRLI